MTTILGLMPQPEDTHVCVSRNITMHCERLSSTQKTCYPRTDTTVGKKYCAEGWKPIDRSDLKNDVDKVKVPLPAGGFLECNVVDGVLDQQCYFNYRKALRSEFE